MAAIRRLSIPLGVDAGAALDDIDRIVAGMDALDASARRTQDALASVKMPGGSASSGGVNAGQGQAAPSAKVDAGGAAAMVGMQVSSALAAGQAPMAAFLARFADQFNRVGGTITTLARRIDNAIKFSATQAAVGKLRAAVEAATAKAAATGIESLTRLERSTLRIGPAAIKAAEGYSRFETAKGYLQSLGDVAGKSLDRIDKRSFATPAAGAKKIGEAFATVPSRVNRATAATKGLGREIALSLGLFGLGYKATQGIKDGLVGSVKSASDFNETVSKTKEVFGGSTGLVTDQVNALAKSFGLVKGPMLDAASSIGLIAKGAGQSDAEAASMATTLTKLAADASSFYNVPLDVALDKFRSGLVGEAEPLRAFGVLLSEDAVKAEALRLGLGKGTKELSEQSKVTARASLIQKGLATASGDLSRTQDSAANQMRKFQGTVENLAADFGQKLLPIVAEGVAALFAVGEAVASAFPGAGSTVTAFVDKVVGGLKLVGIAARNMDLVWDIATIKVREFALNVFAAMDTIPGNLSIVANYMQTNWLLLIGDAFDAALSIVVNYADNIHKLSTAIGTFLADPMRGFEFNPTPMLKGFEALSDSLPKLIKPGLVSLQKEIDAKAGEIADREKARADGMAAKAGAKGPAAKLADNAASAAKEAAPKLADAAEHGSKEAYSAIVKAQGGMGQNKLEKVADAQLGVQRDLLGAFRDVARRLPDGRNAPAIYSFG